MSNKLDLTGKLDFSEIDLTAPDKVIEELLFELPEQTNGIILGNISEYNGYVISYRQKRVSLIEVIEANIDKYDIQDDLGEHGEENHKFECFLYTSEYKKYKYRMFFMQYGIANYPVQLVLEESIAQSIAKDNLGYVFICNTREELEQLVLKILTCKKVLTIMQELIRIHQAKVQENNIPND